MAILPDTLSSLYIERQWRRGELAEIRGHQVAYPATVLAIRDLSARKGYTEGPGD